MRRFRKSRSGRIFYKYKGGRLDWNTGRPATIWTSDLVRGQMGRFNEIRGLTTTRWGCKGSGARDTLC